MTGGGIESSLGDASEEEVVQNVEGRTQGGSPPKTLALRVVERLRVHGRLSEQGVPVCVSATTQHNLHFAFLFFFLSLG